MNKILNRSSNMLSTENSSVSQIYMTQMISDEIDINSSKINESVNNKSVIRKRMELESKKKTESLNLMLVNHVNTITNFKGFFKGQTVRVWYKIKGKGKLMNQDVNKKL